MLKEKLKNKEHMNKQEECDPLSREKKQTIDVEFKTL